MDASSRLDIVNNAAVKRLNDFELIHRWDTEGGARRIQKAP
jgi:hypothetical protein